MTNTVINDQRPILKRRIESISSTITRLEKSIADEWNAIKDFTVSYGTAESAGKRIEQMRKDVSKFKTERRKIERTLEKLG